MNDRTYGWYATHDTYVGCDDFYETDDRGISKETHSSNLKKGLQELGVLDQVPTLENFKPLIDMFTAWWEKVDKDWSEYTRQNGGPLVVLHWVLGRILQDPNIDHRILRYTVEACPRNTINVVYNPNVPEDLVMELLDRSGGKNDPTSKTKGGEIGCFILHNKKASSTVIDKIAQKTKRASIQKDVIDHPNVARETLVFLFKNGRSEPVKRLALRELTTRGWLDVK